jgi:hypothetical protein
MIAFWLPIVVSTIALFFASFLSWMVVRLHEKDWVKMPSEDEFMGSLAKLNIPRGNYMFPGTTSPKEVNEQAFQQKYQTGPRGVLQVYPVVNMGKNLGLTFAYFLVCNATFAYLASFALSAGDDFVTVFRFVATVALLTFLASIVQHAIWFRIRITGHVIESVAYSLIAGAIFAATWPGQP